MPDRVTDTEARDFDKLWDFSNPESTEAKFRELLGRVDDPELRLLIQTQIARTFSLRGMFTEAHATLDAVENELARSGPIVRVRYFLERGRTFNSAARAQEALSLFERARALATESGEINFEIDAVHMLAIASPDHADQIRWNLSGIELCTRHPEHSRWLRALYNNLGETYRAAGQYEKSLSCFQKLLRWYEDRVLPVDRYARVDEAKLLRLCNRPTESLKKMSALRDELLAAGETDGFVEEELAESLEACGRVADSRAHFRKAWDKLKTENWIQTSEPARWQRLQARASD
jgi:tetratricopeptide (TPR) repeat protein